MKISALILFLIFSVHFYSQRIVNFNLYPSASHVGVKFTITKGNDCGGYKILHSTDSLNFAIVEDFAGICGSTSTDDLKSFTHSSPAINRVNYYKIQLATTESSPIKSVFIADQTGAALLAYPNPLGMAQTQLNLRVANADNKHLSGFLFNQLGKPIREFDLITRSNMANIDVNGLNNGLYVLRLSDGEKSYMTKILIAR